MPHYQAVVTVDQGDTLYMKWARPDHVEHTPHGESEYHFSIDAQGRTPEFVMGRLKAHKIVNSILLEEEEIDDE